MTYAYVKVSNKNCKACVQIDACLFLPVSNFNRKKNFVLNSISETAEGHSRKDHFNKSLSAAGGRRGVGGCGTINIVHPAKVNLSSPAM